MAQRISIIALASFLGLVTLSATLDAAHLIRGDLFLITLSYWGMGIGAVIGLLAFTGSVACWGASARGTAERGLSATCAMGSVVVTALSGGSWLLRSGSAVEPGVLALLLGFMGAGVAIVTGGVAGELLGSIARSAPSQRPQPLTKRRRSPYDETDEATEAVAARA